MFSIVYRKMSAVVRSPVLWFILGLALLSGPNAFAATQTEVSLLRSDDGVSVYLPLRATCEALGYAVEWQDEAQSALVSQGEKTVIYPLDDPDEQIVMHEGSVLVSWELFAQKHGVSVARTENDTLLLCTLDAANQERLLKDLTAIASEPRPMGSPANEQTRLYIAQVLTDLGYEVTIQEYQHSGTALLSSYQAFEDYTKRILQGAAYSDKEAAADGGSTDEAGESLSMHRKFLAGEERPLRTGFNVEARQAPVSDTATSDILLLVANYASSDQSPGANYNGSGVAALLEIARLVKDLPADTELRLLACDDKDDLLGSFCYVQGLTDEELNRIVGVIDLNTCAGDAEPKVFTADGESNILSEFFADYPLAFAPDSDHANFYSPDIPAVKISTGYASKLNTPADDLASLNLDQLSAITDRSASVVAAILSEATPSYAPLRKKESLDRDLVHQIASTDFWSGRNDRHTLEETFGLQTVRLPMVASAPREYVSVQAAMVQWWGLPLETHFEYGYGGTHLRSVRILPGENTSLIREALESRYEALEPVDLYTFGNLSGQALQAWRGERNEAYVFVQDGEFEFFCYTTYQRSTTYEFAAETLHHPQGIEPSTMEGEAWEILRSWLIETGMQDRVKTVTFMDDGYGRNQLAIALDASREGLELRLDARDLLDEQGGLHSRDELLHCFVNDLAGAVFNDATQAVLEPLYDKDGAYVRSVMRGFTPEAYISLYVEAFEEGFETDPESEKAGVALPVLMMEEMQRAFVAYVTGEDRDSFDEEKIEFFRQFPEFDAWHGLR